MAPLVVPTTHPNTDLILRHYPKRNARADVYRACEASYRCHILVRLRRSVRRVPGNGANCRAGGPYVCVIGIFYC